jgi:HTH-type transcriptional regulator/antitoxin HigA
MPTTTKSTQKRCPMNIKPIRNERDHESALRRVEDLWDSPQGSAQSDELGILATLIDAYEREHHPIELPDPIDAIKFRLEQQGKNTRALIGVIGHRTRVHEVLNGKRPLSLNMIHNEFGIPAHVLIQPARKARRASEHRRSRSIHRQSVKSSV